MIPYSVLPSEGRRFLQASNVVGMDSCPVLLQEALLALGGILQQGSEHAFDLIKAREES